MKTTCYLIFLSIIMMNCDVSDKGGSTGNKSNLDSASLVQAYIDSMSMNLLVDTAGSVADAKDRQEKWIGYLNDGKYSRSWNRASDAFKAFHAKEQWIAFLVLNYEPLGRRTFYELDTAYYTTSITGYPSNRDYVDIIYKTKFEQMSDTVFERTIMIKEGRRWKTGVYNILWSY